MTVQTLVLPATLERVLALGHPWVYRDHVPPAFGAPGGSFVRIRAGAFTAYALWDDTSPLALRVYSRKGVPDAEWVAAAVDRALALRLASVGDDTTAYRWLFGEGDGLPGFVVDRYGEFAVVTLDSDALEPLLPWITSGLVQTATRRGAPLAGIVRRRRDPPPGAPRVEALHGVAPPEDLVVKESGLLFRANVFAGQKTGLFLDQRENRRYVERVARGKRVLNLFSYTGGFSVYAARGGASFVASVDQAADALTAAQDNFRLNGHDPATHAFYAEDAFDFLAEAAKRGERFDVVITDPPSFARSKKQLDGALRAYQRLHAAALAVTGELYVASSCTSQVDPDAFRGTIAAGAERASRSLRVVFEAGHAADHPIAIGHAEGRYLKFVVSAVDRLR